MRIIILILFLIYIIISHYFHKKKYKEIVWKLDELSIQIENMKTNLFFR